MPYGLSLRRGTYKQHIGRCRPCSDVNRNAGGVDVALKRPWHDHLIAHAELAVVEGCGHMAPLERPEPVTSALVEFLT